MTGTIAENLQHIKAKIEKLSKTTQVIAVSKNHDAAAVEEALSAGQLLFGENRVQEAMAKFPELKKQHPNLKLHLIGPLQTNKVKDALKLFDVIQTLDREKLANEFAKLKGDKEFFIQVNIGKEPQKAGIAPEEAGAFYNYCIGLGLNIIGLMCIPPANEDPAKYFTLLKNMAASINPAFKLSMGMSGDYELAAESGADFVRIGTAIFGERKYK